MSPKKESVLLALEVRLVFTSIDCLLSEVDLVLSDGGMALFSTARERVV